MDAFEDIMSRIQQAAEKNEHSITVNKLPPLVVMMLKHNGFTVSQEGSGYCISWKINSCEAVEALYGKDSYQYNNLVRKELH